MSHATDTAGEAHGSVRGYAIGFVLSIVLTAIPFGLVMSGVLSAGATLIWVFATAAVQILVHLHYFLHMDRSSEQRWNIWSFVFTALVMGIFIGGSMWIMWDLHVRMMGVSEDRLSSGQTQLSERPAGMLGWEMLQGGMTAMDKISRENAQQERWAGRCYREV